MWLIPHYRAPVFRQLSQNQDMDFEVWAGNNSEVVNGVTVASAADTGKTEGIKWHELKGYRIKGPIFHNCEWQSGIISEVWRRRIDVVIACQNIRSLSNWLVAVVCRLRGVPFIDWGIGVRGPERGLKWFCRKMFLRLAKAHLHYGKWAYDWYVLHKFDKNTMFIVYNSLGHDAQVAVRETITEENIKQTREQYGIIGPEDRLIIHTGRLVEKNNLPFLFDALKVFKRCGKNVKLMLIGDGPEEQALREKALQNDIEDRVIYYGACYDENVIGKIISASDLCVTTGAVGLIVMHSLVYGTPILTRDNTAYTHGPEIDAVIEGKTGGYFRHDDFDHLIEKMEAMLYPVSCKVAMKKACMEMIDNHYTPKYQEKVIVESINYVLPPEKRIPVPS